MIYVMKEHTDMLREIRRVSTLDDMQSAAMSNNDDLYFYRMLMR